MAFRCKEDDFELFSVFLCQNSNSKVIMLHTYYYVNGKRVSMERYLAAADSNDYNQKAFAKAKKYYETHQWEWNSLLRRCPGEEVLALMMLHEWEQTEEGKKFKNEWDANYGKRMLWGCLWPFIIVGVIVGIIALRIYFKN